MVKLNDIISFINSENIEIDKYNEVKEYFTTLKGKNASKFIRDLKTTISKNKFSEDNCEHSIEDVCLYYDNQLSEQEAEKIEMIILKCDNCNMAYQSLKEFSELDEIYNKESKEQELYNITNIKKTEVPNKNKEKDEKNLNHAIFTTLLKKIKNSFDVFGSGFATGSLVAAAITLLLILPKQKNIEVNSTNETTIIQTSNNQTLDYEQLETFNEAIKNYQNKEYNEAINKLKNLIDKKTDYYEAYWYIAKSFQAQNKKNEAKMYFNMYIDKTKTLKNELDLRIKEAKSYE